MIVVLAAFAALLTGGVLWYRGENSANARELDTLGLEMKAGFEQQLLTAVAHIRNRPTSVHSKVETEKVETEKDNPSKVETVKENRWFWQRRDRVLLKIMLSAEKDLSEVQPMAEQFVEEYLARPGNRGHKVRVLFTPREGVQENDND